MQPGPSWDTALQRGWEGQCRPWDVPGASQGVLGHPSVSLESGWALQRLGSCHHHGNIPQPAEPWLMCHHSVSSFLVSPSCSSPTSPGSSGHREAPPWTQEVFPVRLWRDRSNPVGAWTSDPDKRDAGDLPRDSRLFPSGGNVCACWLSAGTGL